MTSLPAAETKAGPSPEIQDFFDKASKVADVPQFCTVCGREMKYFDATFFLYGTESSWKLRVPVCDCQT
jgi:hypothetical protein